MQMGRTRATQSNKLCRQAAASHERLFFAPKRSLTRLNVRNNNNNKLPPPSHCSAGGPARLAGGPASLHYCSPATVVLPSCFSTISRWLARSCCLPHTHTFEWLAAAPTASAGRKLNKQNGHFLIVPPSELGATKRAPLLERAHHWQTLARRVPLYIIRPQH